MPKILLHILKALQSCFLFVERVYKKIKRESLKLNAKLEQSIFEMNHKRPLSLGNRPWVAKRTPLSQIVAKHLGNGKTNILDIGARWGSEGSWWDLAPLSNLIGFEPDKEECGRLNANAKPGIKHYPVALGLEERTAALHVTQLAGCSSLLQPDTTLIARYKELIGMKVLKDIQVSLTTLDKWWEANGKPHISFAKLDTQGLELDIMKGGKSALANALGIEVEVEFSEMYLTQPLFSEVDTYLRAQGFTLWRLGNLCHHSENPRYKLERTEESAYEGNWHKFPAGGGRLFWGMALYFKDYKSLLKSAPLSEVLMLASLLEASGELDGALHCLKGILSERKIELSDALLKDLNEAVSLLEA